MKTNRSSKPAITQGVKAALGKEPGLSVKDLANRLDVNRQFMAGFLAALEERGEISCRKVGPARIYFNVRLDFDSCAVSADWRRGLASFGRPKSVMKRFLSYPS